MMQREDLIAQKDGLVKRLAAHQGVFALVICCLIASVAYWRHGRDPLAFAIKGNFFAVGDPSGNVGYDGQFAYYIAVDPLGAPAHIDDPPYRYQRILYPLLARLLSLGQPALTPWALILINVASISMSAELLGRMLGRSDLSPYLALLVPLWLGQIFALRADLNEPLCFLLVVFALDLYERGRYLPSALALAAGTLAKESALLFLPAAVLVLLLARRWRLAGEYALIVLLPYMALQLWLYLWLGRLGIAGNGVHFEWIPFYGIAFNGLAATRIFLTLFFAVPVTGLLVLAARQLVRTPQSVYAWALLVNCLFIVFLTRASMTDTLAVFRLATGVVIVALLFCAEQRLHRVALVLFAIWSPPSILAVMIPGFLL
jgi:hypothetical protein